RALVVPGDAETVLILRMGSDRTSLIFARSAVALFASTIEFGGAALTAALAHELGIVVDEAERLKRESGLIASAENKRISTTLGEHVGVLVKEVARYIGYWSTHGAETPSGEALKAGRQGVSRVYLCGGGANLRGLASHLSSALALPVSLADVWTSCFSLDEYIPTLPRHESLAYCAAVGLALRGL
ncbi:MAG: pilus assembly protein PilM, partial [Patescibacteria group bacterium]|nr:pilus assembly protein PilM [Patescibacteria group bacterium]